MKNWPILTKITTPFIVCACLTQNCGSRAKIKNTTHTCLFALSNTFQNCMSWSGITNGHGGDILQVKGLDAGPVLQGGDWAWILPPPPIATWHQQNKLWKFCQNWSIFSKVIHDFPKHRWIDTQMDRHTNKLVHLFKSYSWFSKTQTHRQIEPDTQTNHTSTKYGYGWKIFALFFLPFLYVWKRGT